MAACAGLSGAALGVLLAGAARGPREHHRSVSRREHLRRAARRVDSVREGEAGGAGRGSADQAGAAAAPVCAGKSSTSSRTRTIRTTWSMPPRQVRETQAAEAAATAPGEPVKTAAGGAGRAEPARRPDSGGGAGRRPWTRRRRSISALSDEDARDLALIIELSQQRAPAAFARGERGAPTLAVRVAPSAAFEARLRDAWSRRGRTLAGPVVLFSARAAAPRILPPELHVRAGPRGVPSGSERSDAARRDSRRARRAGPGFRRARLRRAAGARSSSRSPSTSTGTIARSPRRCGPDAAPVRFAAAGRGGSARQRDVELRVVEGAVGGARDPDAGGVEGRRHQVAAVVGRVQPTLEDLAVRDPSGSSCRRSPRRA